MPTSYAFLFISGKKMIPKPQFIAPFEHTGHNYRAGVQYFNKLYNLIHHYERFHDDNRVSIYNSTRNGNNLEIHNEMINSSIKIILKTVLNCQISM